MQGLTQSEVLQLLRSLLPAELALARQQEGAEEPIDGAALTAQTRLDQPPLRLDSLERLNLAGTLNRFFCLHETGVEDRLLAQRQLGDWAALIAEASARTSGLVFSTSGSTGEPKPHHHSWAALRQEGEVLAETLGPHRRVIAWLPVHHLYGFMLGVAAPRALGAEVLEAHEAPAALAGDRRPGDLIATVPARWRYLADSGRPFAAGSTGVSSTAPLEQGLRQRLLEAGLGGLAEIYGATETGGVGVRWAPETAYRLLPHWERGSHGSLRRLLPDGATLSFAPLDRLEWLEARTFRPAGRLDGVVQVGGVNVSPERVAERIRGHEAVADCAVRPFGEGSRQRLKAFIVPADGQADREALREALTEWLWESLPAAERPIRLSFGERLPRNELGKLQDWD